MTSPWYQGILNNTSIPVDSIPVDGVTILQTSNFIYVNPDLELTTLSVLGTLTTPNSTNLASLTSGEISQLLNINSTTISATQWGYLGVLDQNVSSISNVTFRDIRPGLSSAYRLGTSTFRWNELYVNTVTIYTALNTTDIYPTLDNTYYCGDNSRRWIYVWGMNAQFDTQLTTPILNCLTTANLPNCLVTGNVTPSASNTYDLGSTSSLWNEVFSSTYRGNGSVLQLAPSTSGTTLLLSSASFDPNSTNAVSLGLTSLRWSNVFSVLGNFSGLITAGGGITLSGTLTTPNSTNLASLTTGEVSQLLNIDANTISNTQWGYLSGLNQALATTSNVTHANITATTYLIGANTVLSGSTLGSTITSAPGLTSLGNLTVLNMAGNIVPTITNTYQCGTTSARWADINSVLGNFSGLITAGGGISVSGNLVPAVNNASLLGTTLARWSTLNSNLGNFSGLITASGGLTTGADILPSANNLRSLGETSTRWANIFSVLGNFSGLITASGGLSTAGNITPTTTNARECGTSGLRWSQVNSVLGNFSGLLSATAGLSVSGAAATFAVGLAPTVTGTQVCGSSALRWSQVNSVLGNFSGLVTTAGLTSSALITGTSGLTITGTSTFAGDLVPFGTLRKIGASGNPFNEVYVDTIITPGAQPTIDNTGSIGTSSLYYAGIYATNTFSTTVQPRTTNTGSVGTSSRRYEEAYVNKINPVTVSQTEFGLLSTGTLAQVFLNTGSTGIGLLNFYDGATSGAISYNHSTNEMRFLTGAGVACFGLNTDGRFAIGKAMDYNSTYLCTMDSNEDRPVLYVTRTTSTATDTLQRWQAPTQSASAAFTVFCSGNATLRGTLTQGSDRRIKENIAGYDGDQFDDVQMLSSLLRKYNKRGESLVELGFVAQDLISNGFETMVLENLEDQITDPENPELPASPCLSVKYDIVQLKVLRATSKLIDENNALKQRLNQVEARISALESA